MEEQERQENADQAEPELLYHYTTLDGLLGIAEKGGAPGDRDLVSQRYL
ncbi:MAG: hypothetical protein WCF30_05140 [Terracidiphilus sp.]